MYCLDIWHPVSSPDSWLVSPEGIPDRWRPCCAVSATRHPPVLHGECKRRSCKLYEIGLQWTARICKENDLASILISGHQKVSENGSVLSFEYLFATQATYFRCYSWIQSSTAAVIPSWGPRQVDLIYKKNLAILLFFLQWFLNLKMWHFFENVQELKEWETVRAEKIARLAYQKEQLFLSCDLVEIFAILSGGADRTLLIQERLVVSKKWLSDDECYSAEVKVLSLSTQSLCMHIVYAKRDTFFVITLVLSHYVRKPYRCNKIYQFHFSLLQTWWSQGWASMKPNWHKKIQVYTVSYR